MVYFISRLCCLLSLFTIVVNGAFDCSKVTTDSIAPLDPMFPPNSCIIIKNFEAPDCTKVPEDRMDSSIKAPDPCPGLTAELPPPIINGTQIFYTQLEDAIANCPFDPVRIEMIGTIYTTGNSSYFFYNGTRNIILHGNSQTTFIPGQNITTLVPVNTTFYNNLTNMTEVNTTLVPMITNVTQDQYITLQTTIVGFKNFQVTAQNISVTLDNILFEGCGTEDGLFLTLTCPESCGNDTTVYCKGAWFPKNANTTDNVFCQSTGGFFNDSQRIAYMPKNDSASVNNPRPSTLQFQFTDKFTAEAWVNPSKSAQTFRTGIVGNLIFSEDGGISNGWGIAYDNQIVGHVGIIISDGTYGTKDVTAPVPAGQWTHIAATWGNSILSLYLNGILVKNDTMQFSNINTALFRPLTIGASRVDRGSGPDGFKFFEGIIDEVRVWNYARTASEIQVTYNQVISPATPGLYAYYRFTDGPSFLQNSATPPFPTDSVLYISDNSELEFQLAQFLYYGNLTAVPDCFCYTEAESCTPSELFFEVPPGAVTSITIDDDPNDYEFINGMLIEPNGIYGSLWLPGVTSTSGPIFNQTIRFIPGRYETFNDTILVPVFNSTTNTTEFVEAPGNGTTSECIVPGVIPSILPPLGSTNPWQNLTWFVPGWFANDGKPPFWAFNFFPGRFVQVSMVVPTPVNFEPGDWVFEPGIRYEDGTWVPFSPLSPYYITPITVLGGFSFNCTKDVDDCIIPELPVIGSAPPPISVIEDDFGCVIDPLAIEPTYLDPTQRDPCFILRDIRAALPEGTEVLNPEEVLACDIKEGDKEPEYLDPTQRNPCWVLKELRELITPKTNCSNGLVPIPAVYMPCLKNQNLTLNEVTIQNYLGDRVICQWACDEYVTLNVINSDFKTIPGNALWSSGLHHYDVHGNTFCPCGGKTSSCVYLNANHITAGRFIIYNNRHCAIQDLLPVECEYDITPELKCSAGELLCLDIATTLEQDCQQVEVSPGVLIFDDDCAVYAPCQCATQEQNITLPDGSVQVLNEPTGELSISISFVTPLISELTNGSNVLTFSCNTIKENRTFIVPCFVNTTVEMTVMNVTTNVTILVASNCTYIQEVVTGSLSALECPCPRGFNASLSSNLTGSAAAQALGLYSQCQWDIPGGLPGEMCLDQVVQCPYLGGTLGSGQPPPVPIGLCDAGTAKLECSGCSGGYIPYEGKIYPCPGSCNATIVSVFNATTNTSMNVTMPASSVFTVACDCNNFALTVSCQRNTTCIPTVPCSNFTNVTLCAYTGTLTFDGVGYPCFVAENATDCLGISYAASSPANPPDGQMTLPCDNSYVLPSPGPCTCIPTTTTSNNITLATNATVCNFTADPNCTEPVPQIVPSGDPALQLQCLPSGQLSCRCDGLYAVNPFNGTNTTLVNTSAAFHIDNVPKDAELWFQQNNVAQQLPIGWRFERFLYDLIQRFPLKVLHWYSGHAIMHESGRKGVSPYITGTVWDWVDGHDLQWNFRYCVSTDPGPAQGVYTNECQQYRPSQNTSCVVDSTYDVLQTPDFGVTRFNRITDALMTQTCLQIIVHKAVNVYEERMKFRRKNIFLCSYDNAVVVNVGHQIRADNCTIRGLVMEHTNANDLPLIQPTPITDNNFDTAFEDDEEEEPAKNFRLLNCHLIGHNVNKAGAVIGLFGVEFTMQFNLIEGFYTRTVLIAAQRSVAQLNTFLRCPGRVYRVLDAEAYVFEENLLIDCTGIKVSRNLEIVSFRTTGDIGRVAKQNLGSLLFQQFTPEDYALAFNTAEAKSTIDPTTLGCNPSIDPLRQCYVRGNRQKVTDEEDIPDYSAICFRFVGGNITVDRIRDNVCSHAKIGMDFSYTYSIDYTNRDEVFARNALIRTEDTYKTGGGADFSFRTIGSLVTVGCFFPNCWPNTTFPAMEVNPRFDLIISERYGFEKMNNLTEADRWGLPLNLVNVTSERAILRRETFTFVKDLYAVGFNDIFCCHKPIFYGSKHLLFSPTIVLDNLMLRFIFLEDDIDNNGDVLLYTPPKYLIQNLRLYNICMDGQYTLGTGLMAIGSIHVEPYNGIFVMDRCRVFNWWHLPLGSVRGLVRASKGSISVVILPDNETIFYSDRLPNIDGFFVYFQQTDRTMRSRFVRKTKKNPIQIINSMAIITNNEFRDLDGNVFTLSTPGSWDFSNNQFLDCGMRQNGAVSMVTLEGNPNSVGSYFTQNNIANTTKPYLYPLGGGAANRILFSAFHIFNFRFPFRWIFRNNTVVLGGNFSGVVDFESSTSDDISEPIKYGWFRDAGPKFLNAPSRNKRPPKPNTWDAGTIADRDIDPSRIITGTNGEVPLTDENSPYAFDDPDQRLVHLEDEDTIQFFFTRTDIFGYTIALRIEVPPQVIIKTLTPSRSNYSMFSYFQPILYPYRLLSIENGVDSAQILAAGNVSTLPTNGPGLQGIKHDIVSCPGYRDVFETSFSQCTVCNDGCPVQLPDACYVDPLNATYVNGNPYFGTWLFHSLQVAMLDCKNPKRLIYVTRQPNPYIEPLVLEIGNWTIMTKDNAQILVSVPIQLKAHNIILDGFDFMHNVGDNGPTFEVGFGLDSPPENITLSNISWVGFDTEQSAIVGEYGSLAIIDCRFREYEPPIIVNIRSNCGILFFQNNTFLDVKHSAIRAEKYETVSVVENNFENCGRKAYASDPYCAYIGTCGNESMKIVFTDNEHYAIGYDHDPGDPRVAAYWIDGLPLRSAVTFGGLPTGTNTIVVDLSFNTAAGLDIGLRVTSTDDLSGSSLVGNKRATVAFLAVTEKNHDVTGTWHFIVWGTPAHDSAIQADPSSFTKYYCDDDCVGNQGYISLIITVAVLVLLLFTWCVCTVRYRIPNRYDQIIFYSETLGRNVTTDIHMLPKPPPERLFAAR